MEKRCENCANILNAPNKYPCGECINGGGYSNMWRELRLDNEPKTRADILKEVEGIICKDRNEQYGEPEDNFKRIAVFWSNYLDREITSADVAIMMVLFKAARIANDKYKADSWVDICGYSACGAECAMREVK